MTYSDRIECIKTFLQQRGVLVIQDFSLPAHLSGECNYAAKTIRYNESSAIEAFDTLTHEAGHWLMYEFVGWLPQWLFLKWFREWIAEQIACVLRRWCNG